ncbi:hypothetical protein VTL71DRAFT_16543 [Oculimacula yallundae]|uniref:Uncharacterized protein n=1 Tax=Oculimacula yallundae TaxID=86028 RepID=A0ABR4CES3_9HELO
MEDEPFNSSDIEFSLTPQRFSNTGTNSIALIRETMSEDRIASKKRARNLTDIRGAPATQYSRSLSLNRLREYANTNNLTINPESRPDRAIMVRFVDTIVKYMKARADDDTAVPLRQGFKYRIGRWLAGLRFEYPLFNFSKYKAIRIDALID